MTLSFFDIFALLLVLAALFGFINQKLLKLPRAIGLVVVALLASGTVIALDVHVPWFGIGETARGFLNSVDFSQILLQAMLSALLFAGAVHVDLATLKGNRTAAAVVATFSVVLSTFLIGGALWATAKVLDFNLPFAWALVFGALIAPTDPVAVLGMLRTVNAPPSLEAKITGELLLNNAIAVIVFTIVVAYVTGTGHAAGNLGLSETVGLFLVEAAGGAALGLVCAFVAYLLMRWIDEPNLEVLITLALVAGAFAAALHLQVSAPIAVAAAGLLIANRGRAFAMSDNTREHVVQFWDLTEEILSALLFLLIGLEVLVTGFNQSLALLVLLAIPIVLVARWTSVAVPIGVLRARRVFTFGAVRILTWGGLRGALCVALALSLPEGAFRQPILAATYAVVIFSIIGQAMTMRPLVRRLLAREEAAGLHDAAPDAVLTTAAVADEMLPDEIGPTVAPAPGWASSSSPADRDEISAEAAESETEDAVVAAAPPVESDPDTKPARQRWSFESDTASVAEIKAAESELAVAEAGEDKPSDQQSLALNETESDAKADGGDESGDDRDEEETEEADRAPEKERKSETA